MTLYTSLGYKESDLDNLIVLMESKYNICYEIYNFGSFGSEDYLCFLEIEGLSDLAFNTILSIELVYAESLGYVRILDSWFNQLETKKSFVLV